MKYKIDIADETLCKIIRDEMEELMGDHPSGHHMAEAADEVLDYFSYPKQYQKSMKRVKKPRKAGGWYS